jgi:hypothetical protein
VRPAPMGRAYRVVKRTAHLTVAVAERAAKAAALAPARAAKDAGAAEARAPRARKTTRTGGATAAKKK